MPSINTDTVRQLLEALDSSSFAAALLAGVLTYGAGKLSDRRRAKHEVAQQLRDVQRLAFADFIAQIRELQSVLGVGHGDRQSRRYATNWGRRPRRRAAG